MVLYTQLKPFERLLRGDAVWKREDATMNPLMALELKWTTRALPSWLQ
jgi:hypothetical protein